MSDALSLATELISRATVTPVDAGCQQMLAERLERSGFKATHLRYADVNNLWITHGEESPCFIYVGHTDVVPTGPVNQWISDPFKPEIRDGFLYGRGAADMKGSIASMVTAMERFVASYPDHAGTIGLLLTSDEEGPSINGTRKVVEYLEEQNIKIDWCLVGEPSSKKTLGDVIKNGRRGSLGAKLTVFGIQGHVAYPHLARNPIHLFAPALAELSSMRWDDGNEFYPPTSFQVSNLNAGTGADNVIPGHLDVMFNFRFSTEVTQAELEQKVEEILARHQLEYDIEWKLSGQPFVTTKGELLNAVIHAVKETIGVEPEVSTGGGTSDGRFIAPTGAQIVELGPVNATIHKLNECVKADDLDTLSSTYENILQRLFC